VTIAFAMMIAATVAISLAVVIALALVSVIPFHLMNLIVLVLMIPMIPMMTNMVDFSIQIKHSKTSIQNSIVTAFLITTISKT